MDLTARSITHHKPQRRRQALSRSCRRGAAAAAIAALVGLLPATGTQAAIVYSGVVNVAAPNTFDGVYLNVITGASGQTKPMGWDINIWHTSLLVFFGNTGASFVAGLGATATSVDNLALGTLVNASQGYDGHAVGETAGATSFLLDSSQNYVGFMFHNEDTNRTNFGWFQLSLGSAYNRPRSIVSWAYENTGAAIAVGNTGLTAAVPEPGSLALVALALAGGFGVLRRRKSG